MAVKINSRRIEVTYSMLSSDTKPTAGITDGDVLEVLDIALKTVVEIWRWHDNAWYKY